MSLPLQNTTLDPDNEEAIEDVSPLQSIRSSASVVSSLNSEDEDEEIRNKDVVPVAYEDRRDRVGTSGSGSNSRMRRRSSGGANQPSRTRSYSSSYTFASQALNTVRNTLSRSSSASSANPLSRESTRFSTREIYGDMGDNDVRLRRSATRNTILSSLSRRVQSASEDVQRYNIAGVDEEESGDSFEEGVSHFPGEHREDDLDEEKYDVEKADRLRRTSTAKSKAVTFYENLPDTTVPTADYGQEFSGIDPELITWDGDDDPEYPRNWPLKSKIFQTGIVAMYTLVSPMTSSLPSPAMPEIAKALGMEDQPFLQKFSVSVMVLAWALGPLIIAPISESEAIGRRPVLNSSIWINFAFNMGCGFCHTPAQLCIFRFLGGLGGCAALNVGAGTLADLFDNDQRLVAMAFYSICPTLGPVLSPVVSSFVVSHKNWRWVFHVLSIFNGFVAIFGMFFFKETYSPKLLYNKCKALQKETGNTHLHTIFQIADGETKMGQFMVTIKRPVKLLFTHPMVLGLGSFMAFTYGFMYLMVTTFPTVYKTKYHFSVDITGLMYLPMGVGYVIGIIFFTFTINKIYHRLTKRNGGVPKPEYRLPCLCFSGVGIPVGLIWYGWSAEKELHWIMPSIGTAIFAFSFIAVFQTIQNYLIDMNNRFAASSIAAAAVFRSLFGFAFPLFASAMYDRLGYGWGNTLCGLIGLVLGLPFPIFCLYYGERLRNWANRRMDDEQARRDAKNLERLRKMNQEKLD